MSTKALKSGSARPPLKNGQLRLYSMRFCPYVQRVTLIVSHHKIPCEIVNINLKDKPDWFCQLNPDGRVPLLESDRGLVSESVVCAEYLDEAYGKQCPLPPADPFEKAQQRMLVQRFEKFTGIYYSLLSSTANDDDDSKKAQDQLRAVLEPFERALTGRYFGGEAPNLLDFLLWPWFERRVVLKKLRNVEIVGADQAALRSWIEAMEMQPAVRDCRLPDDVHVEFIRQYFDPSLPSPDYDLGIN